MIPIGIFCSVAPKVIFDIPHYLEFEKFENVHDASRAFGHHYYEFHQHITSYVVGFLVGYSIRKKPNLYLGGRIGELFIWVVSWGLTFWSMWWHRDWLKTDYIIGDTNLFLWMLFGKLCFVSGWAWTIYACSTGRGGKSLF
jgi:hypothetical protein